MKSLITALLLTLLSIHSYSSITIKIGAYDYPPFYSYSNPKNSVLYHTVNVLNKIQNQYKFKIINTSPKRRYQDLYSNKIDLVLFEDQRWGWRQTKSTYSAPFMVDGEKYICAQTKCHDQNYFNNLKNKTIIAIYGYHYGFANFSSPEEMSNNYNISFVNSPETLIHILINDKRGQIGIIPEAYLRFFLSKNTEYKDKIYISDKYDQRHHLGFILAKNQTKIGKKEVWTLLKKLSQNKIFINYLKQKGLTHNWLLSFKTDIQESQMPVNIASHH